MSELYVADETEKTETTMVQIPCEVMDDIMALLVVLSVEPDHLSPAARAQYDSASSRRTRSIARQAARDTIASWSNYAP